LAWNWLGFRCAPKNETEARWGPQHGKIIMAFISRISRRSFVQTLLALPAFGLFKTFPAPTDASDEIVEVKGWIVKRSDLA